VKRIVSAIVAVLILISSYVTVFAAENPYPYYQTIDGVQTVRCTYYAWQQAYNNTGVALPNFGDAGTWYSDAANAGYSVGSEARAKSIAVWSGGTYGHVAYVVSVSGDKMTVNEGGQFYNGKVYGIEGVVNGAVWSNVIGSKKTADSDKKLVGFIYLDGVVNETVSVTHGCTGKTDSITDSNAIVYGTVSKPSSFLVEQFGIRIRKANDTYANGWSLYHASSSRYVGTSNIPIWFNVNEELGLILTHATSYTYQLYAKVNGTAYWSVEKTFTTTSSVNDTWLLSPPDGVLSMRTGATTSATKICDIPGGKYITITQYANDGKWDWGYTAYNGKSGWVCLYYASKHTSHSYGSWQTVTNAICTATGTQKRTCACGAIDTQSISALGHNYSSAWTVDTVATCMTAGSKSRHCTRCGAKTDITAIPATTHSFGPGTTTLAPTCTSEGREVITCFDCGTWLPFSIPALGHNYSSEWTIDVSSTCTTAGSKSHHCTRCEAKSDITEIPVNGHSWGNWETLTAATENEDGMDTRKCGKCDVSECLITFVAPGCTEESTESFTYEYLNEADCAIIGYTGTATEINIPTEIGDCKVTTICEGAFINCIELSSITIESRDVIIKQNTIGAVSNDFVFYGYTGSTAETYADQNEINFVPLAEYMAGDADGNKDVNMLDIIALRRYLINSNQYPLNNTEDANADGTAGINMLDIIAVRRYLINRELYPLG